MVNLIGEWSNKREPKMVEFPKHVQTTLGQFYDCLTEYRKYHELSTPKALRKLWDQAIKSDIDIPPVFIETDSPVITVPITEKMFDTIEALRGYNPRSAVLRAMTVAILKQEGFIE